MASIAIFLVLLPMIAKGDDNNVQPYLTPFWENMCKEVECGRGSCKVAVGSPFNFKCECDSGWKRTRLDDEDGLEFLPCVVPNCSVEYSCMPAAPPSPPIPYNLSFFDPCYWMYCGEGTCTKNLTYTHTCQCNKGYYNLLNVSAFPCYSDCAIGSDCEKLGITSSKSTSSNHGNPTITILLGKFHWIAISLMSIAMVLWK
ncbi:hypothetical protein Acr_08g0004300 [Actinidia rufa]|uniref:Neurogenic locus notch-like protein n=1 Tax=Actinidia rufa TaxID=165716 RepID=A0A7J0F010_9ERIC|nr:hypothetical protein Acr_08g0004300 [Actinidia rufa]